MDYAQHVSPKQTPQSSPIPGKPMVENSAGGFAFDVNDWQKLDRFLILGCEGGSYYAGERAMAIKNTEALARCFEADATRVVRRIVEISEAGRAPKNDPAIFALAYCASYKGEHEMRVAGKALALAMMPRVCRTGTHLFQFADACNTLRGWGRSLRRAISRWYIASDTTKLSYQVTKYQSRGGWSHRDLLRLAHPKAVVPDTKTVLHWCVKGWPDVGEQPHEREAILPIWAFERAKKATSEAEVCRLIREYDLPRECIPTHWLTSAAIWEALLESMPMMAMVRNLGVMTKVGLLSPLSAASKKVCDALENGDRIMTSRLHPISILIAAKTYAQGRGDKGKSTWTPDQQILAALDGAFYKAFRVVVPTNKRWLLAIDVSGSMDGGMVAGVNGLTPRVAAGAMALVTASVERDHHIVGFTAISSGRGFGSMNALIPINLTPMMRLEQVCQTMMRIPMGGTDCALPMLYALNRKIPVDAFMILTDSETWAGGIHPCQALTQYRQKMGIDAKLIVNGMVANDFSIADPNDPGMLDVVGFDTTTPQVCADFLRE